MEAVQVGQKLLTFVLALSFNMAELQRNLFL